MAPKKGSTNMMSKSLSVFSFIPMTLREQATPMLYMFGTTSHAPNLLPNLKTK